MTPAETYEKMAKETDSQILGQLYRERAAALRKEEETKPMSDDFTNMFKNAAPIGGGYSKSATDEAARFMEGITKDKAQNEASAKKHGTHARAACFETSSGCVYGRIEWEEDFATSRGKEISMGMTPRFVPDEAGEIIINQMYDTFPGVPWSVFGDLKWVNIPLEDGHYGSPEYKLDYSNLSHVTDGSFAFRNCPGLTSPPDFSQTNLDNFRAALAEIVNQHEPD